MIKNVTVVPVAFVTCHQLYLWLSGPGLAFLARLH